MTEVRKDSKGGHYIIYVIRPAGTDLLLQLRQIDSLVDCLGKVGPKWMGIYPNQMALGPLDLRD
jgi:hypothetical protein